MLKANVTFHLERNVFREPLAALCKLVEIKTMQPIGAAFQEALFAKMFLENKENWIFPTTLFHTFNKSIGIDVWLTESYEKYLPSFFDAAALFTSRDRLDFSDSDMEEIIFYVSDLVRNLLDEINKFSIFTDADHAAQYSKIQLTFFGHENLLVAACLS